MYMVALDVKNWIDLFWAVQIATLKQKKSLTIIKAKYIDYDHVFFSKPVIKLSKNTGFNKHIIK